MKRTNRVLTTLALGAVLAMSAATAAAGGRYGGWDDHQTTGLRAAYKLDDLTPEQRQQLDALRDEARKMRDQWQEDRTALRDAIRSGADVETIRPLAEKRGEQVTQMILQAAEVRAKLNQILTPEQQAQLKDSRCDRRWWN